MLISEEEGAKTDKSSKMLYYISTEKKSSIEQIKLNWEAAAVEERGSTKLMLIYQKAPLLSTW